MLNEWSDREPDPGRPGWSPILAAIILIGAVIFLANLVVSILGD